MPVHAGCGTDPAHHRHLWRDHAEDARRIAGEWRSLIAKGIDPAVIEAEAPCEKAGVSGHCGSGIRSPPSRKPSSPTSWRQERNGKVAERNLRTTSLRHGLTGRSAKSPASTCWRSSTPRSARAPKMAARAAGPVRRFFNWAVDAQVYGLIGHRATGSSVKSIIGAVPTRNRRLADAELFAFWRATGRMGYPIGPVYRMLLLTGLRLNEARAAIVAGDSGRHHRHPGIAHEGQGRQGGRTSGAGVVGDAGGHRVAAAHQGREVPVLAQAPASVRWR